MSDSYSNNEISFTYTPNTVTPDYCEIKLTCKSVSPSDGGLSCQDLDENNRLKWTFSPDDYT